jgi:hypothetical protein
MATRKKVTKTEGQPKRAKMETEFYEAQGIPEGASVLYRGRCGVLINANLLYYCGHLHEKCEDAEACADEHEKTHRMAEMWIECYPKMTRDVWAMVQETRKMGPRGTKSSIQTEDLSGASGRYGSPRRDGSREREIEQ